MRIIAFFFFFFSLGFIYGQASGTPTASELNHEGKAILDIKNAKAFDKVMALAKFRKSQQLILQEKSNNENLRNENNEFIDELVNFFSQIDLPDSILQTTIFYPDSVFRANPKYSEKTKTIIPQLLETKRRKLRKLFSKIDGLNYRDLQNKPSSNFIMTFDRYWPLEVIEYEEYLNSLESDLSSYSVKSKKELLYSNLKNELDSINFEITSTSLNQNINHIQQQKNNLENELAESKKQYSKLKYIGFGVLALIFLWAIFIRRKGSQLLKGANQKLLEEKKRSEELLLNILPAEVAKELKSHASVKAKKHEGVTVLFSDFKNFSGITNQLGPEELVKELDYCFKAFDRIIDKHRLQKIKTIGDAYMCVGGLHTKGNQHVARMTLAALEIQKFLNQLKKEREGKGKHFFEARIGIHTGPIVSGVVGSKKFAFDIWGDTVNVAQQMETNGSVGRVAISGETYDLVKTQFECKLQRKIEAKNKKQYDMYFVERRIR